MNARGLTVNLVDPGSIAGEMGVDPGDILLSLNGQILTDILDYHYLIREGRVTAEVKKKNGERWELDIEKDPDRDLGIDFKSSGMERIIRCKNKCIFCFVDQMPRGLRKTLYIKDDDYRLSFLQGSFITLTNITDRDFERIGRLRLSPLYISVHTTNPGLRQKMMGNPGAKDILAGLKRLTRMNIEVHTQAVICPGVNDGAELYRTISDLTGLWPGIKSLAVVPAGLTGKRDSLYPIGRFNSGEAAEIVDSVRRWQEICIKSFNYPFVFAGDELHLLAGREIPPRRMYADFPQTENGVGLARIFLDQWSRVKSRIPSGIKRPLKMHIVTGTLAGPMLEQVARRLCAVENLQAEVVTVENSFFGHTVTVAGLLTGRDIIKKLKQLSRSDLIVLPSSVMRRDSPITLDGITLDELEAATGAAVKTAPGPAELIRTIKDAAGD